MIDYGYSVLRKIGIPKEDIRIRLSDISIFKLLCQELGLSDDQKINLQKALDTFSKNRALGDAAPPDMSFLGGLEKSDRVKQMFELYGNPRGEGRLYDLATALDSQRIPVTVDLSVVRGFNYYTGPVFQYDVRKEGRWVAEVGGGGRYDNLIGQNLRAFGVDRQVPATGFAFETERITQTAQLPKGRYTVEMVI